MSRRRRSRFTSWSTGDEPADDAPEQVDGAEQDGAPVDEAVDSVDRFGDGPDETASGVLPGPSLSDLLVGGNSLSEQGEWGEQGPETGVTASVSPDADRELAYDGRIVLVPIGAVSPNAVQPRRRFEESSLAALAASIAELGVLQPVIVRPLEDVGGGGPSGAARYELVAGERRWRAARRAGLDHIPALIREVDDLRSLEEAIVENLHRVDLNPMEEANAFQQLVDDFGLTQEDVSARVGKSRSAVANTLRLLQLPGSIQRMVVDGDLSAGHARSLLSEPNLARQRELAAQIIDEELSVRQAEDLVRGLSDRRSGVQGSSGSESSAGGGRAGSARGKSAGALEVEGHLADLLDTRVRVTEGAKRGSITIEFADAEDLDRIYRLFVGPRRSKRSD